MSKITGTYKLYKNENLDNFFAALGLPYLVRKMLPLISPTIEFNVDGDTMTVKVTSALLTQENKFKLGEEYIEKMPRDTLKSVTLLINDTELVINSVAQSTGYKTNRHYLFSEDEVVETLTHEKATGVTRRFYRRVI